MDKILVTLLLVVVGVAAVVGLNTGMTDQKAAMIDKANIAITNALSTN